MKIVSLSNKEHICDKCEECNVCIECAIVNDCYEGELCLECSKIVMYANCFKKIPNEALNEPLKKTAMECEELLDLEHHSLSYDGQVFMIVDENKGE
jgi:hypothetical protein